MSGHALLAVVVLWPGKNGYWIIFSCVVVQQIMYKGQCAECNAHWHSKAFKSQRAGYDLPVASECQLGFAFESAANNKICGSCNQKNFQLMKHDRDEKEAGKIDEAKVAQLDENGAVDANVDVEELEVQENVDVTEKEGTAISVLLCLSKL
jgi:hypothetical protein